MADIAAEKKAKPEQPDQAKFELEQADHNKATKDALAKFDAIKAKYDAAKQGKDSPAAKRKAELIARRKEILNKQAGDKGSRQNMKDKIAALEAKRSNLLKELKDAKSKTNYRSGQEVEDNIKSLRAQIDTGKMKLADERKAEDEIKRLVLWRKEFANFDKKEQAIQELKDEISEKKKSGDTPEAKALSDEFNAINKELDELIAQQNEGRTNITNLKVELDNAYKAKQEVYDAKKAHQNSYYENKKAYRAYTEEARKARDAKFKADNEAKQKEKRKEEAKAALDDASFPAFHEEIVTAESLIKHFDPTYTRETKPLRAESGFAASSQRVVDDAPFKGTIVTKKDDRDDTYFAGTGGKKGKKNKKAPEASKFNLPLSVIEQLSKVDVEAPTSQSDVPGVIEKLKAKVSKWKSEQDAKTKENIAKAQAKIDKLEAEATNGVPEGSHDNSKKASLANSGVNGHPSAEAELAQEEDGVKDAAKELEAAKLED